ncbi:hypothetical protein AB205_0104030, partial [Aquarana catesbeiana]
RAYVPERDVSVDESLMAYKGRLSWIQYIASKRAQFGIKSYMLCESSTGYIWNSVIYTDKKDVCLMSTVHNISTATVHTKGGKDVLKPQVVIDYNCTMRGVDRSDQAMTFYLTMRKQQKKYYKKIFRNLLEQCLWNTYILHRAGSDRPLVHADFIWKVAEQIFVKHQMPSVDVNRPGRCAVGVAHPETPNRDDKGKKIRKESRFYCPDCDVGLCAVPCFKMYHTQDVY